MFMYAVPTAQLHTRSVIRSPREKAERVWLCGTVGGTGGDIDMQGKDGLEVKGEKPQPERERGSIGWLRALIYRAEKSLCKSC